MTRPCIQCGGEVKANGKGFKCLSCGSVYASEQELIPPQRPTAAKATAAPQSDGGVDVFDKNINGVLEITWSDKKYRHSGSGFLINQDGLAITNAHVVTTEEGKSVGKVNVKICGESVTAEVLRLGDDQHGLGKGIDLALIKLSRVPDGATVIEFADSSKVKNGENIFVIGNSLGYGTCITKGIISDNHRVMGHRTLLMTDCAINGGNSGGPMFNEKGMVIGAVCSGITDAEGMNFAIPANEIVKFAGKVSLLSKTLPKRRERTATKCPQCEGTNFELTVGGFFWCMDCDCEW